MPTTHFTEPEYKDLPTPITHHIPDEEVWLKMWCAVANAANCKYAESAKNWADEGLKLFQQRFRK